MICSEHISRPLNEQSGFRGVVARERGGWEGGWIIGFEACEDEVTWWGGRISEILGNWRKWTTETRS